MARLINLEKPDTSGTVAFIRVGTVEEGAHAHGFPLIDQGRENSIIGSVRYMDTYENAITNISKEFFERTGRGRPFRIFVQSKHYVLKKINKRYSDSPDGELLAIFNSLGLMEIAIRNGNAGGLMKLETDSTIRVDFNEEENA